MYRVILLACIVVVMGLFAVVLAGDLWRHRRELRAEPGRLLPLCVIPAVVQFLGTFGVSDFAINTFVYRRFSLVPFQKLPGTLNVDCVIPVCTMALCYIATVEVAPVTLIVCIAAQMIGTCLGVRYMKRLPKELLRLVMGCALICSGLFIFAGKLGLFPLGGQAVGLPPVKLGAAALLLAIYGALNTAGFGSTAPSLATLYALGLSPLSAFPVVMGASCFATAVGSIQFVRAGIYGRKICLLSSVFGVIGVIVAVEVVKNIDVGLLQWIVGGMIVYTGGSILVEQHKLGRIPSFKKSQV